MTPLDTMIAAVQRIVADVRCDGSSWGGDSVEVALHTTFEQVLAKVEQEFIEAQTELHRQGQHFRTTLLRRAEEAEAVSASLTHELQETKDALRLMDDLARQNAESWQEATDQLSACEFCRYTWADDDQERGRLVVCNKCWDRANEGSGWMQRALAAEAVSARLRELAKITVRARHNVEHDDPMETCPHELCVLVRAPHGEQP